MEPSDDWWSRLCDHLERLRVEPGYVTTPATKARNHILSIDREAGRVVLMSERSRSGEPRTITAQQVRNARDATTNGVILRALWDLAAARPTRPYSWHGPFKIRDLLDAAIDDGQDWPPDDGMVYLVTRHVWEGDDPSRDAEPLYLGGTTGAGGRFVTRIGDFLADAHGFYGTTSGHSSGGQSVYEYACEAGIRPGDLYLAWLLDPTGCRRCAEVDWHERLCPSLNRISPPGCLTHRRKNRP